MVILQRHYSDLQFGIRLTCDYDHEHSLRELSTGKSSCIRARSHPYAITIAAAINSFAFEQCTLYAYCSAHYSLL